VSRQSLNLPINIPWKQIAVSPDMMDEKFCNKLFPFAWRSSMAISVYEPRPEDLPEELCGDQITYVKVTTSITGYQPSEEETKNLDNILGEIPIRFPDTPQEDWKEAFDRITHDYFACYGVMLNVAVFPYPNTKKELIERNRIDFSKIRQPGVPNNTSFLEPGSSLDNPYEHPAGVKFEAPNQQQNSLVNIIPLGGGTNAELDLHTKMVISVPATAGLAAVEAKVAYLNNTGVKMEAFNADGLVGTETSESAPNQVHTLIIKADNIEKVIISSPENKASLLEFAYFTSKEVSLELEDYPHIIDFEPKRRDLYQAATKSDEVLSGSNSSVTTNKALTHTESTESSLKVGASSIPGVPAGGVGGSVEGAITNKVTDQDKWSVQTDASRERRETHGATAQLSQMYNLLTGYHAGTNRASFLMLARPHVLQPTDFRTFVQGLRAIEGGQDFFLIVSRPKGIEGLCIETSLETGNFKEDTPIEEPPEEFHESSETFWVEGYADSRLYWKGKCEKFFKPYTIDDDDGKWVIDRRASRNWDDAHAGIAQIEIKDNHQAKLSLSNYEYVTTENGITVEVSGRICGADFSLTNDAHFKRKYRVFTRSVEPKINYEKPSAEIGQLLITSRGLCVCFKSGECPEVVPLPEKDPIDHIVDEPIIRTNKALMTKNASQQNRMPLAKEFLSKVQTALTNSHRSTNRYALDDYVGFLESDYFKDQIKNLLPEEYLKRPLGKVKELPTEVIKALGKDFTIDQALEIPLARFARRTGLSIKEASKARFSLIGLKAESNNDDNVNSDQSYDDNAK
jgi:hypothetical protein